MKILFLLLFPFALEAQCPIPTPPPNLAATAISPYSVRFATNPATAPTIGYYAEREPEGGLFRVVNMGYPGGIFVDDFQLLPNHTFCYRTRALTSCGTTSEETNEVMVTMPDGPMPYQGSPEPPYNVTTTISNGKVLITWSLGSFPAVAGQTQTFQLTRSANAGITWGLLGIAGNNRSSYLDAAIVSGANYWYRIRSFNEFGWTTGSYGNCGIARTDCGTQWSNVASISIP